MVLGMGLRGLRVKALRGLGCRGSECRCRAWAWALSILGSK